MPLKNKMCCLNDLMSYACMIKAASTTHLSKYNINAPNVQPLNTQMTLQIVQQVLQSRLHYLHQYMQSL